MKVNLKMGKFLATEWRQNGADVLDSYIDLAIYLN